MEGGLYSSNYRWRYYWFCLHKELKKGYRKLESAKTLAKLGEDYSKISFPTRSEMIGLLTQTNAALRLDKTSAYTSVWVLNAFDGSGVIRVVGLSMQSFSRRADVKALSHYNKRSNKWFAFT